MGLGCKEGIDVTIAEDGPSEVQEIEQEMLRLIEHSDLDHFSFCFPFQSSNWCDEQRLIQKYS